VLARTAGGTADGEEDLGRLVRSIRRHLRRSDSIVRLDSCELVCVVFGVTAESASERFVTVREDLNAQRDPCGISVGFAARTPVESFDKLVRSSDAVG
jgi:PleD family two-component response regulator